MKKSLFYRFKWSMVIFFLLIGSLIPFFIFGFEEGILNDDFETYFLGQLVGQGNWLGNIQWEVVDEKAQSGIKSVNSNAGEGISYSLYQDVNIINYGIQSSYFYIDGTNQIISNIGESLTFFLNDLNKQFLAQTVFKYDEPNDEWDWYIVNENLLEIKIKDDILLINEWNSLEIKWELTDVLKYQVKVNNENWTEKYNSYSEFYGEEQDFVRFWFTNYRAGNLYLDNLAGELEPVISSLQIVYPENNSEEISNFIMSVNYNKGSEDWEKIMIVFESWNEESNCPIYDTSEFWEEYQNGWFYYQSSPFFSPSLETKTGLTFISVFNLDINIYNCVRCYFSGENINISNEKCEDYILTIIDFLPPAQPLLFPSWFDYYNEHTGENFDEPTAIFNTIAGVFDNVVQKLGSFINNFRNIFDNSQAEAKGKNLGEKIPLARGYLAPINDFFGGFPISELFIFCLLITMIIIIYRIIKTILMFIRG